MQEHYIENNTINKIKNWQNKIKQIKDDLEKDKIFKINMYPHTFYFAPEDKDRFDVAMSGNFEGILFGKLLRNNEQLFNQTPHTINKKIANQYIFFPLLQEHHLIRL